MRNYLAKSFPVAIESDAKSLHHAYALFSINMEIASSLELPLAFWAT